MVAISWITPMDSILFEFYKFIYTPALLGSFASPWIKVNIIITGKAEHL
jgi:hypothetical protein